MALLSLALPVAGRLRGLLLMLGLAGASLFFGDAMITPAISVLSAIEGLEIATLAIEPYVVPVAGAVLVGRSPFRATAAARSASCSAR